MLTSELIQQLDDFMSVHGDCQVGFIVSDECREDCEMAAFHRVHEGWYDDGAGMYKACEISLNREGN